MEGGPPVIPPPLAPPSDLSATEQPGQLDATAGPESLPLRLHDFSVLTPSARTSYTRVDLSAADIGRRTGGEEDGDGSESDGDEEAQGEQGPQEVEPTPHMPQVSLTFLLVSGRRRTMSFDHEITVGRVKELVWNAWPNEWQDERPPSPSYLRILYLGKILQDDDSLTKVGFPSFVPNGGDASQPSRTSSPPPSTIVHLSIRSFAPAGSDATKKKGRRRRMTGGDGADEPDAGCCAGCCVIC